MPFNSALTTTTRSVSTTILSTRTRLHHWCAQQRRRTRWNSSICWIRNRPSRHSSWRTAVVVRDEDWFVVCLDDHFFILILPYSIYSAALGSPDLLLSYSKLFDYLIICETVGHTLVMIKNNYPCHTAQSLRRHTGDQQCNTQNLTATRDLTAGSIRYYFYFCMSVFVCMHVFMWEQALTPIQR